MICDRNYLPLPVGFRISLNSYENIIPRPVSLGSVGLKLSSDNIFISLRCSFGFGRTRLRRPFWRKWVQDSLYIPDHPDESAEINGGKIVHFKD